MNQYPTTTSEIFAIVRAIEEIKPFALAIFNRLNGDVNPLNPCYPNIQMYSNGCLAQFMFPNTITLYLGSIIWDHGYIYGQCNRDQLLSIVLYVLAHEMYHADQHLDCFKYSYDKAYMENVESAANAMANDFCIKNGYSIGKEVGFIFHVMPLDMPISNNWHYNVHKGYIEQIIDCITGIFRCKTITENALMALQYPTAFFRVYDNDDHILADIPMKIDEFDIGEADAFMAYEQLERAKGAFAAIPVFNMWTKVEVTDDRKHATCIVIIKEQKYYPFKTN